MSEMYMVMVMKSMLENRELVEVLNFGVLYGEALVFSLVGRYKSKGSTAHRKFSMLGDTLDEPGRLRR
jgi:hypothetical protein